MTTTATRKRTNNKNRTSVYALVTERILSRLESGVIPWKKPWGGAAGMPQNLISRKGYRGINAFLLACTDYESPYWLTFKQAKDLGGSVRKGEKSEPVIFWNEAESTDPDTGEEKTRRFLRYYRVFNLAQCDLPDDKLPEEPDAQPTGPRDPIASCEAVVDGMPNRPEIRQGFRKAAYVPASDEIVMPDLQRFDSMPDYYATLFHELGHSTGHASRLDRPEITEPNRFGSEPYGREELVAEMSAAYLCHHAGIETETIDNAAAYVGGWLKAIKKDETLIVKAASAAQKAASFILGDAPAA
ncbi:MAG: zincin-like metallopeptidase domain-containing protein [Planctomycetota bacterium]